MIEPDERKATVSHAEVFCNELNILWNIITIYQFFMILVCRSFRSVAYGFIFNCGTILSELPNHKE